ncbi:MAG TPA: hypothetical protein VG269_28355 [Tepidisphaeraceae bacterium]|nr:hypothetical protein [Tepidisphaeraceae bacterium]
MLALKAGSFILAFVLAYMLPALIAMLLVADLTLAIPRRVGLARNLSVLALIISIVEIFLAFMIAYWLTRGIIPLIGTPRH